MMHRKDIVVGEWAATEIKCTVLDEVSVSRGLAPGAKHRTLHLDKTGQHVHFGRPGCEATRRAFRGKLLIFAHAIDHSLDLIEHAGLRGLDVLLLAPVDETKRLVASFHGEVGEVLQHILVEERLRPGRQHHSVVLVDFL